VVTSSRRSLAVAVLTILGAEDMREVPEAYSARMGRYGNPNPEGDDRPPGMHDPLEDEDRLVEQLRDGPNLLTGGWTMGGPGIGSGNWGQGMGSVVVLVGLAIRGVFLLVTWPVRWAWRRRKQSNRALGSPR